MMSMDVIRETLAQRHQKFTDAGAILKSDKIALEKAKRELEDTLQARVFIQDVAKQVQEQAHTKISSVVSKCLRAIFDDPYEFRIDFKSKRGKTEAVLSFERNEQLMDPMDATGGGVVDVASFALRTACLALSYPPKRKLLMLDEPFKNVSKACGYLDRIPDMLQALQDELGIQIVMITHMEELKVGEVIDLG